MRIGLLFRALGAAAVLANADPLTKLNSLRPRTASRGDRRERRPGRRRCAAHMTIPGTQRLRGRMAHRGARARRLQRRGQAGRQQFGSLQRALGRPRDRLGDAPFHFAQLLAPKLSVSGATPRVHLHLARLQAAGAGRRSALPISRQWRDGATSPYLYAFASAAGREGTLSDASLTGPSGAVRVNVVDNHTPGAEGYLPPGGILVPAEPLEDDSTYTAQVTFTSDEGQQATRRWTSAPASWARRPRRRPARPTRPGHATAAPLPSGRTPRLTLACGRVGGGARATIAAQGNAVGRSARVTLQRLGLQVPADAQDVQAHPVGPPLRVPRAARCASRSRCRGSSPTRSPYRGLTLVRTLS